MWEAMGDQSRGTESRERGEERHLLLALDTVICNELPSTHHPANQVIVGSSKISHLRIGQ